MGILSTIGKSIEALNIVSSLKRVGALAVAIIVIPAEAVDSRLSLKSKRYEGLKAFCSESAGTISNAAKATAEFTKLGVETMEATAQIVLGKLVVDRLQKVGETIQKRADKLQGEEKEIIRDPQRFREDRAGRKEIWQQARQALKIAEEGEASSVAEVTSLPSLGATEEISIDVSSEMIQDTNSLESNSLTSSVSSAIVSESSLNSVDENLQEEIKSSEKATMRERLAKVGQAIKAALTGVQGVASKAGQGVAKGAKSVASGAANVGSKIAEDRKFRTAERHLDEKIVEIKQAKQDLLKKNPGEKEGEKNKSHKEDDKINEKRIGRTKLAAALGIDDNELKEKLKPLKVRADYRLGIKPDRTPTEGGAAKSDQGKGV